MMIREDTKQAWVTIALSDKEALQSLVLAKSLEHALTTRKICIFISQAVSREMKYLLFQTFDIVTTISDEELEYSKISGIKPSTYALLWLWSLKGFGKCVFVDSGFAAKTTCDDLFKYEEISGFRDGEIEEQIIPAIFVFRPNFQKFEKLMKIAKASDSGNLFQVLNSFFEHWTDLKEKHVSAFVKNSGNDGFTTEYREIYLHLVKPFLDSQSDPSVRAFITRITTKYNLAVSKPTELEQSLEDYRGTIAVVGMSCRLPGANNATEYWKLLSEGREAIRRFPSDRPFLGKPQARDMQAGFLNCAVDEFDAKFFGISPREALLVDPQQRLLLEVTWESLEHAGINPQTLRDSDTGVYVGMWQQDYERIIFDSKRDDENDETTGFLHIFLGNKYSATASRISFCLGLNGPAIAVESGCSSSLNGLHLACEGLQSGETSLALVSGVNLILLPFNPFSGKDAGEESVVLSKDYKCKTFDESADGFVRAEACGVVVLKRFEDAWRDGDNILAVVKGSAVNNDGQGTSFGTPNEKAQEKVYRAALKHANIKPAEVSYIETHGTGTAVGDPIEMYAVGQAYSEDRVEPLMVGSVKTNIGHCEAAAGIASLIKVILCMEHSAIPPHLNLKTLNPRIDLSRIPAQIPMELTPWKAQKKIAAISSFSMSATNAHVILQEAPTPRKSTHNDGAEKFDHLITISAKSEQALTDLCKSYVNFLKDHSEHQIQDIAYIANTGRAHLQHRLAVVASDSKQLLSRLEKNNYVLGKAPTLKSKIGFLFTGQGSQYFGMTQGLADAYPVFQNALDACNLLFKNMLNKDLRSVLWIDENLLNQTLYCQPALFCVQYCLLQLWNFYGVQPDCVLGHSVGEFAAAVCAGILTLEDAMKLVTTRSKLVNDLSKGSMTAIRATEVKVAELIKLYVNSDKDKWIDVAAVNSTEEVVVSGLPDAIKSFETFCLNNGVQSVSIPATHAFHSRAMEPVLDEFGKLAGSIEAQTSLKCTYISGTLAKAVEPMEFGSHYWQRHLRDSVKFSDAIRLVWSECKTLLEIGPQPILLGLTMATVEDPTNAGTFVPTLRKKDDARTSFFTALCKLYVAGFDYDWANIYGVRQKRVNLPLYPFQRQKYWFTDELSRDDELSPLLHPLLGRQFLSPVTDLVFCQTYRLKELKYIEDHKVANFVIVPVAALLESFMAAGREVLQGGSQNRFPITIQNLQVEAALPLEKSCRIQTLVSSDHTSSEDTLVYNLSLNRKMENHFDKWKRHAHATFTPSSTLPEQTTVDLEALKATLNHRESLESSYKAIADVGIQFGPKFQSVSSAWYGPTELLTQINLPEDHTEYICHPIVLDAIIQTSALREYLCQNTESKEGKKALYLPISIRKFTWLSRVSTSTVYAHSVGQNGNVTLYSSNGEPLGIMEGLELLQTSVTSVIRAIRADAAEVPDFMCDRWRPVLGKSSKRIEISKLTIPTLSSPNVAENKETIKGFTTEEIHEALDIFRVSIFYSFVIGIQESGWPWPAVNKTISPATWKPHLPSTLNEGILMVYLNDLENRGYLRKVNQTQQDFLILKPLESIKTCEEIIEKHMNSTSKISTFGSHEKHFGRRFMKCFPLILQGKMTPLAYFFPEDESEPGAQYFYTKTSIYNHQNVLIQSFFTDSLAQFEATTPSSNSGILRILEVGAGTGSSTVQLLQILRDRKIAFQYTFTDISPLFLNEAKKLNLGPEVKYQTFNMEEDPLIQGFAPQEFDIILGVECVHATVNICETLANLKRVLRVGGSLILGEDFKADSTNLFVFGMSEGWWRFNDFRRNGKLTTLASEEQWHECLTNAGFDSISSASGFILGALVARNATQFLPLPQSVSEGNRKKWLVISDESPVASGIVRDLCEYDRKVEVLTTDMINPEFVLLPSMENESVEGIMVVFTEFHDNDIIEIQQRVTSTLLRILKSYDKDAEKFKARPKFMLVTRGVYYVGDAQSGNPNGATACALMKVFKNEHPHLVINLIDLDQNGSNLENELIRNQLWSNDGEYFVKYCQDKKYVMRLTYSDKPPLPIQLPATDRFRFINPESGAFTDIEVGPRGKTELLEDNIELEVRACALNFRDIFMVLKPEGFALPDEKTNGTLDSVGLDVSGVVSAVGPNVTRLKVGDEVFGMTNDGALGSHTVTKEKAFMKIPPGMTFVEACTIPVAFITAHISLIEVAKITSADRVLIHVATGGVGLASIQVAKHVGAEIYATAGNKRKRAYLRALGIKHVYHSRDTSFGEGIERDTNGQGVNVVLNSLTGPNFKEKTLKACSQGARFVEIAKINIWKTEEVTALRPDVEYTIVDLSQKKAVEEAENKETNSGDENVISKINAYVNNKIYTGLPSIVFQLSQVREAFYYFQKALHIGKIVVQIPKYTQNSLGKFEHKINIFNEKSTYLITGGLGGLGLEVTKWMRNKGAKTIVLVGRSPPNESAQRLIDGWNRDGSQIIVMQADVGELRDCSLILEQIQAMGLPALRGIMHAAGVLSDNFISNQTEAAIQAVLKPKVYGGWYLHSLTINYSMEFFIMFSSLSGILGMIGQCNHAAANRFLDSLAHYRVSMGLPCTTINWGAWSEIGAAANIATAAEVISGFRTFMPSQGIAALENIMTLREVQVAVSEVTDWNVVKSFFSQGRYMDEMKSESVEDKKFEKYDYLIQEIKVAATMEERQAKIQIYIEAILKQTLNLPDSEVLDIDQNFSELGVDSLMAMEMKNRFQAIIGNRTLSISSLQENRTIRSLSAHLAQVMENEPIDNRPLAEIVEGDVVLPPEITASEIPAVKPSEFKQILLTGTTGHLGIHCLVEVLNSSNTLIVHCLVRGKTEEDARERLLKTLGKYRITLPEDQIDRVKLITGDMTRENLGLEVDLYQTLTAEVDAILNCAAKANHLDSYSDGTRHDIRTHNVIGLIQLLKFACAHRTKPILHASTLFAATKLTEASTFVEDFPEESDLAADMKWGYLLSKFVGEKLLREARNRGIPVTCIRYPFIFGNSETGHMPVEHDHIWSTVLASIRVRMIPKGQLNGIPLIAVDSAAKITAHIFLEDQAEDGMYNLTVNSTVQENLLADSLKEMGIPCEFVDLKEWTEAVFDEQDSKLMGPLASLYKDENGQNRMYSLHGLSSQTENIDNSSYTEKMMRNFPEIESVVPSAASILRRQVEAHLAGANLPVTK